MLIFQDLDLQLYCLHHLHKQLFLPMVYVDNCTTEKRIGDTGDPWGMAPVDGFPDS
jgi:hypothetical protein